ncbi:MAG: NHLP leader peptide family RiPP precursor [Planctomycetota bacterium]|nr:NHLP leader peptide family RiPP precursor [Planctomycetota bacterium]MEE2972823.1 NHLP leader peptide family RiPP precursor [Planctomycetota bacterium]
MTEQKNRLAELFAACWRDEALKTRFMSDPRSVLAERGMAVPDGVEVVVVEDADDCVHITLPADPVVGTSLSDEELVAAAGGDSFWDSCDRHSNCTLPEGWFC